MLERLVVVLLCQQLLLPLELLLRQVPAAVRPGVFSDEVLTLGKDPRLGDLSTTKIRQYAKYIFFPSDDHQ